ncbi:MAG: HAMP domain-containing histidine kinase [Actinobacteria bacterium]|nr:HAMP domain-containing histidine kinase [Actinomycetota bacterium]
MFKTLWSRIIVSYFLVVIICLVLASMFFVVFLSGYSKDKDRVNLERQVGAIAQDIERVTDRFNAIVTGPGIEMNRDYQDGTQAIAYLRLIKGILDSQSSVTETKLFIVDSDGNVLVESSRGPPLGTRKVEIEHDPNEEDVVVKTLVFMPTNKESLLVIAPTKLEYNIDGYLVGVKPVEELGSIASLLWYVIIAGSIALGISMLAGIYLSWAVSRPVKEVAGATRKMAEGDYSQEVEVKGPEETAELARDFNQMARRVRTSHEMLRNFVGDVSHELRTPLTSIEGFSQALLDGICDNEEKQKHYLNIINQESKRMYRVINDLLLLSSIDAGELVVEKEQVDVAELMRKMESIFKPKVDAKDIELNVDQPTVPLEIRTDRDRLELILTNLMDNAVKFTRNGGTVSLESGFEEDRVRIQVIDNGEGIDAEVLPNLFDRFYRVEKSRAKKHGGSGLGLSICKELAETLGGSITVNSAVGQGTTFTVELPVR